MSDNNNHEVLTDQALTSPKEDKFGRAEFAERVANILISKSTPDHLTIGIYGKWGDGKTSVINFIKHYLDEDHDEKAIYLDFNPWRYKDEDLILNSFFKQFAQGITNKLGQGGIKIAKTLLSYSGLIVALAEPVTGLAMFTKLGGWSNLKQKFTSSKDFVNDNDFSPAINSLESALRNSESLEKQKERISKQLTTTEKKYIVFIDDIDRLDKKEIQVLFSLLKTTADFSNVIYVLGFDDKIVATALGEIHSETGERFLEKIIQVPLNLPKVRKQDLFDELLYSGIDQILRNNSIEITQEEGREIGENINNGLKERLNTPRMVKRYLNALMFSIPILKGEVNLRDLIMIEGLRICYPREYEIIYEFRELFISSSGESIYPKQEDVEKEQLEKRNNLIDSTNESLISLIKSLFPRTLDGYWGTPPELKDLARAQRICSEYYFERYFTYSIHKSDLSDQKFSEFIIGLPKDDAKISLERAIKLIESSNESTFLRKIEENFDIVKRSSSPNLANLLATLGERFITYEDVIFDFSSPLRVASSLIANVIDSLDEKIRFQATEKVVELSTNIILTAEIMHDVFREEDNVQILNKADFRNLQRLIAKKIKIDWQKNGPFFLRESKMKKNSSLLMKVWETGNPNEINYYIKVLIEGNSKNAIEFLKTLMPTSHSSEGKREFSRFEIDQYNSVKRLIDPKLIFDSLSLQYAEVMKNPESDHYVRQKKPLVEFIAESFAWFYLKDQETKGKNEDKNL